MLKKLTTLLCVGALAIAFVGCESADDSATDAVNDAAATTEEAIDDAAAEVEAAAEEATSGE